MSYLTNTYYNIRKLTFQMKKQISTILNAQKTKQNDKKEKKKRTFG